MLIAFKNWNEKTFPSKILTLIGITISIAILILSFMQICNIWDQAITVFTPLLGVFMIIQTIENWKGNRSTAYFSLFAAIFVFHVSIIILF